MSRYLVYSVWFLMLFASLAVLRIRKRDSIRAADVLLCAGAAVSTAAVHLADDAGLIGLPANEAAVSLAMLYVICVPVTARAVYIMQCLLLHED